VVPLVEFLRPSIRISGRKFAIPRALAIVFSYLIIAGVIVVGVYLLAPRLGSQFPEFTQQARDYWNAGRHELQIWVEVLSLASMPGHYSTRSTVLFPA